MATASGEEGRMGTRSRSSTSPELVHHPLNPRVVGWQGWKGGSRGFETGDSWAGFEQSVSVKRMKVCGRRRGRRVVEALRASWQSFAAASQRFQDPGRNRNRNARATNRGPRPFAIQWVAAESRAFVDPLGFAIWADPLSASPHSNNVAVDQPFRHHDHDRLGGFNTSVWKMALAEAESQKVVPFPTCTPLSRSAISPITDCEPI